MHALHLNRMLIDVNGKFNDKRVTSNEFAAGIPSGMRKTKSL
jgi:hypothetical protein